METTLPTEKPWKTLPGTGNKVWGFGLLLVQCLIRAHSEPT